MELVPRTPSERTINATLAASAAVVGGLSTAFALDWMRAPCAVIIPASLFAAILAPILSRRSSIGLTTSAIPAFIAAAIVNDRALKDAVAAAAGALLATLLLRPIYRAYSATTTEGALDRLECVALAGARSVFVAGALALITHTPVSRGFGVAALVMSVVMTGVVIARDRARVAFLSRVYAKLEPSYRIERDADVRGYELLPPILSGMITDAVIAHVDASPATYRTSSGPRPLARVVSSLPKMIARVEKRTRFGATLAGIGLCSATLVAMAPCEWRSKTRVASHPIVAPACSESRAYFADRLERLDDVGRATLMTSAQDPSIAADRGVILLVPQAGGSFETAKARAFAVAEMIPCTGPLTLTIEEPTYRKFAIEATLVLAPDADENMVLADANDQLREIFRPDVRTLYNEHVGFGDTEKSFGYRVRHVLKHVAGVKGVRMTIDGSDKDVQLGPRDFPTLGELSLHATH